MTTPAVQQAMRDYLRAIQRDIANSIATEHTYRPALKSCLESLHQGITATTEPKRIECGAPDFVISRKTGHGLVTIGYLEAKDVGASLADVERDSQRANPITPNGHQLKSYLKALPNLVLTNYLEFRWYVEGEKRETGELGQFPGNRLSINQKGLGTISGLLTNFSQATPESIGSPLELDVFYYTYAVLHSPASRERYAEFLKMDFPRVPFASDADLFRALVGLGRQLVGLHLMESPALSNLVTHFPIPGDNLVEKGHPKYLAPGEPEPGTGKPLEQGRVYINKGDVNAGKFGQFFEGVGPEVWEFQVGGYQVLEKWLRDRRGRNLAFDDLTHYQRIVVALQETIRLMVEIDEAIDGHGGWPSQ